MSTYLYKAIGQSGDLTRGKVKATNKDVALMKIKDMDLYPIEVKQDSALTKEITIGRPVKSKDLTVFCTQFSAVLGAGIPVLESLYMLRDQTANKYFKKVIGEVYSKVEQGELLSSAMGNYKKVFPDILTNMVKAGEATGNLEVAFRRMAVHFDKENKLKQEIKKASIYPIVVGIVAVAVVILLLVMVVPTFVNMFEDMGAELPATTKALIAISDFIINKWYILLGIIFVFIIGVIAIKSNEKARTYFSQLSLKLPWIGSTKVNIVSSRFARTLSTLLSSGLPILDSIDIVSKVVQNEYVSRELNNSKEQVSKGISLSTPLSNMDVFPIMIVNMVKIGEESGQLEEMLEKTANFYDDEVETSVKQLTTMMEPAIIVFMAVVVGFIVISIIQPMFQMYSLLGQM